MKLADGGGIPPPISLYNVLSESPTPTIDAGSLSPGDGAHGRRGGDRQPKP